MPNDEKHKWYDEDIVEAAIERSLSEGRVVYVRAEFYWDEPSLLFSKADLEYMLAMLEDENG